LITAPGIALRVTLKVIRSLRPKRAGGSLTNGDLLATGERAGYDLLLTADKNMRYQQNLSGRKMALVFSATHLGRLFVFTSLKFSQP
jgi:hypothetical protein